MYDRLIWINLLFFLFVSTAQSQQQLESGLSYNHSSLLASQNNTTQSNNATEPRFGLQIALSGQWQKLNPDGALSAALYAAHDTDLKNSDAAIQQLSGQLQKILAFNTSWLSRTALNGNLYDNQQQPANSYQALGINQTFGYFADNNSGWDINLGVQQRNYAQNPSGSYQGQQFELGVVHYFATSANQPRWAAALTLQQFNASNTFYNSNSQQLNLSYGQWHWQKLQGNFSLQWLQNHYPNTIPQLSDRYSLFSLDAFYPITSQWQLSTTLSGGLYQASNSNSRLLINAYFGLRTSL